MNNCAWLCSIGAKESKAAVKRRALVQVNRQPLVALFAVRCSLFAVLIFHKLVQSFLQLSSFLFRKSKTRLRNHCWRRLSSPIKKKFLRGLLAAKWANGRGNHGSLLAGRLTAPDFAVCLDGDKCVEMGNWGFELVF